ncbi:uncharacterized protein LOC129584806 [Paramacrobiotus metropolitanus]|uniref:uncharacterized protein LOC129584806 n=1 Tax=Paramacrobiotus metropolitanus TaxID=2943436 RepID=UPI002446016E|nr:uncharacterized protein LOC129584806 [Paramacrobiotus metropolitanus]
MNKTMNSDRSTVYQRIRAVWCVAAIAAIFSNPYTNACAPTCPEDASLTSGKCFSENVSSKISQLMVSEHESITRTCQPLVSLHEYDNEWPLYVQPVLDSFQRWMYQRNHGYYWTKDGSRLRRQCERASSCRVEVDAILSIKDASSADAGLYVCIATEDCRDESYQGSCRIRLGPPFQLHVTATSTATRIVWRAPVVHVLLSYFCVLC